MCKRVTSRGRKIALYWSSRSRFWRDAPGNHRSSISAPLYCNFNKVAEQHIVEQYFTVLFSRQFFSVGERFQGASVDSDVERGDSRQYSSNCSILQKNSIVIFSGVLHNCGASETVPPLQHTPAHSLTIFRPYV